MKLKGPTTVNSRGGPIVLLEYGEPSQITSSQRDALFSAESSSVCCYLFKKSCLCWCYRLPGEQSKPPKEGTAGYMSFSVCVPDNNRGFRKNGFLRNYRARGTEHPTPHS